MSIGVRRNEATHSECVAMRAGKYRCAHGPVLCAGMHVDISICARADMQTDVPVSMCANMSEGRLVYGHMSKLMHGHVHGHGNMSVMHASGLEPAWCLGIQL